jgi:Mn-dependent DtxR family transcriptional regulator
MADLDDRDRAVLNAMTDGRCNPMLIRERTGLDRGDVNTVLNRLARAGLVTSVTRGLYQLTDDGHKRANEHDRRDRDHD